MRLLLRNSNHLCCDPSSFQPTTAITVVRIMYHHSVLEWRFWDNNDYTKPSITRYSESISLPSFLTPFHPTTLTKGLRQLPTEFLPKHNMTAHISGLRYVSSLIYRTVHGTFFYLRLTSWYNTGMKIVKTKRCVAIFQYKELFLLSGAGPSFTGLCYTGTQTNETII